MSLLISYIRVLYTVSGLIMVPNTAETEIIKTTVKTNAIGAIIKALLFNIFCWELN